MSDGQGRGERGRNWEGREGVERGRLGVVRQG